MPMPDPPFDAHAGTASNRLAPLADTVRERRAELNLTQADLAALAGCSQRFVHTVEQGKATLRIDKLLDVLEVLGLELRVGPGRGSIVSS